MRVGEAGGAVLEEHLEEAVEERMSQAGKLGKGCLLREEPRTHKVSDDDDKTEGGQELGEVW